MPRRIAYYPSADSENPYAALMVQALSAFGQVERMPRGLDLLRSPWRYCRRFDLAMFNWLEDVLIDRQGRIRVRGLLEFAAFIIGGRFIARRIVLVRHNSYPHACDERRGKRVQGLIDVFERCFDLSITHSGHNATAHRCYVPHPLYHEPNEPVQRPEGYFLIFGRIKPYKGIDDVIRAYDDREKRLVIAGPCDDPRYLDALRSLAEGKNVQILAGYLAADDAKQLVGRADAVVLPHHGRDMIVSGSYFFAAGLGVPVLALRMPFLVWASEHLQQPGILFASSAEALAANASHVDLPSRRDIKRAAEENFGRAALEAAYATLFSRLA